MVITSESTEFLNEKEVVRMSDLKIVRLRTNIYVVAVAIVAMCIALAVVLTVTAHTNGQQPQDNHPSTSLDSQEALQSLMGLNPPAVPQGKT